MTHAGMVVPAAVTTNGKPEEEKGLTWLSEHQGAEGGRCKQQAQQGCGDLHARGYRCVLRRGAGGFWIGSNASAPVATLAIPCAFYKARRARPASSSRKG